MIWIEKENGKSPLIDYVVLPSGSFYYTNSVTCNREQKTDVHGIHLDGTDVLTTTWIDDNFTLSGLIQAPEDTRGQGRSRDKI